MRPQALYFLVLVSLDRHVIPRDLEGKTSGSVHQDSFTSHLVRFRTISLKDLPLDSRSKFLFLKTTPVSPKKRRAN